MMQPAHDLPNMIHSMNLLEFVVEHFAPNAVLSDNCGHSHSQNAKRLCSLPETFAPFCQSFEHISKISFHLFLGFFPIRFSCVGGNEPHSFRVKNFRERLEAEIHSNGFHMQRKTII